MTDKELNIETFSVKSHFKHFYLSNRTYVQGLSADPPETLPFECQKIAKNLTFFFEKNGQKLLKKKLSFFF